MQRPCSQKHCTCHSEVGAEESLLNHSPCLFHALFFSFCQSSAGMDSFFVPHKEPSLDDLRAWRKNVLSFNKSRRFRHTANLEKRREVKEMRDFKIAVLATQAALIFIGKKRFAVTPLQLEKIRDTPELFKNLNGIEGIAAKLGVLSIECGINGSVTNLKERITEFGSNAYDEKSPRSFFQYVCEAFQDLTLVILAVCAVISLAVGISTEGLSEGWYDGAGILLSIVIVVLVTAVSDYRQSFQFQILENEKKKIDIEVIRDGNRMKISIYDLVVGDVVILSTGDQVPADGVFISGYSLEIDQSSLTGESEPFIPSKEKPFLLAGTMVLNGSGTMLVTGVGMRTEWGKLMSKLSEGGDNETPLQVRLNGVATLVGKIGLVFALLTFAVLMIRFIIVRFEEGFSNWRMDYLVEIVNYIAISVTIVVVAVPEGLPLAVTLSLAYAMKQMMDDKALVRNLAACETMGSATYICSDKTGTLTSNEMSVVKVFCARMSITTEDARVHLSAKALELFIQNAFLNTSGDFVQRGDRHTVYGSPTEVAILKLGLLLGGSFFDVRSSCEILRVAPFNSAEKKMSVLVKLGDGKYRSFCKGAAEIVLKACDHWMDENGTSTPLDLLGMQKLESVIQEFSQDALRTLCLAYIDHENLPDGEEVIPTVGLTFIAMVGIKDPVRPEVKDAVKLCMRAGIKVCMVTGDNLDTAKAIARECNILTDDTLAVEGPVFRLWSVEERQEKLSKIQVLARSSPSDKLMLVQHLKDREEVVAVTGDGTNDAPALREADIGLAMGLCGTEVAKSSADIIILDDNFSSIVNVAKWGRSVYTNIQKFVQFQLTVNIVALIINFTSACITGETPLTAVQLLWVNLIMDTLGALALATEAPYAALMERPPVGRQGNFITNVMWRNILGQAVYQLIILWVLQFEGGKLLHLSGDSAGVLNTIIFNTFVFCQVFNEINSREMEKWNVFANIFTNVIFLAVLLFTVVFQVVIVEFLGRFANTVPLSAEHWVISVLLGFLSLFVGIAIKLIPVPPKPFAEIFWRRDGNDLANAYKRLASE